MKSKTILIAESGSTKTDWCLIHQNKSKKYQTQGINPFFLQSHEIAAILEKELKVKKDIIIDEIHFYGAGISSTDKQKVIERALKSVFQVKKTYCHSDILAAARATCGQEKGIVVILGTGSNSCFYNGKKIGFKTPSLGYILGDEGGGTAIGKKILQYQLHGIFDQDLQNAFKSQFPESQEEILENIYRKPLPNRYIAHFTQFAIVHRGHYMIENIVEDCLNDLFINHLLRYPGIHQHPVHFTGSVSFYFKDMLHALCEQYDIRLGSILQKPMKGLVKFHQSENQ